MSRKPKIVGLEFNKINEDDIYRIGVRAKRGMWNYYIQAKKMWREFVGNEYTIINESLNMLQQALASGAEGIAELSIVEGPGEKYAEQWIENLAKDIEKIFNYYRALLNLKEEKYKGLSPYDFN